MKLFDHLEKLTHFKHAAQGGSFLAAGRQSGVSQQTIFYAVKNLEDVLGVSLFFRSKKGVRLTSQGRELLNKTLEIEKIIAGYENSVTKNDKLFLRWGVQGPLMPTLVAPIFSKLEKLKPSIEASFIIRNSSRELLDILSKHQCDMAFVASRRKPPQLKEILVCNDSYSFFVRKGSQSHSSHQKSCSKSKYKISDLNKAPVLYLENAVAGENEFLIDFLHQYGLPNRPFINVDSFEAVYSLTLSNDFIALLPNLVIKQLDRSNELEKLEVEPKLKNLGRFNIKLVHHDDPIISKAAISLAKVLKQAA